MKIGLNRIVITSKKILYSVILISVLLLPMYYFNFLHEYILIILLASLSAPIIIIIVVLLFYLRYVKPPNNKLFDGAPSSAKSLIQQSGVSSKLDFRLNKIIKRFALVHELIRLNDPSEALRLSRLSIVEILELIKDMIPNKITYEISGMDLSVIDMVKIWEKRLKGAFKESKSPIGLAKNYFGFAVSLLEYAMFHCSEQLLK